MPVHKLILGGEQYLPFALSKLRQLAADSAQRGGFGVRIFWIEGVQISLRVAGAQHFVTIFGEQAGFDFCFTSPTLHKKGAEVQGHVIRVSYTAGALKAFRVGSNIPLAAGAETTKYDADKSLADYFPLKFFQIDGLIEPRYHSKTYPDWQIMHSWGANTQFSRMLNMSTAGSYLGYQAFDISYDLSPSNWKTRRQGLPRPAFPQSDFCRTTAVAKIGQGSYMLMVDTHNTLHVWRHNQPLLDGAATIEQGEATISSYTSVPIPLPAWAEASGIWRNQPAGAIPYSGFPHYKWEFNSTGDKLVAVAPEDMGDMPPVHWNVTPATDETYQFKNAENVNLRTVMLGMVEFSLTVTDNAETPTGPPTVAFSLGRTIRPSTDDRYILAASYGWDMGKPAVSQDDLLIVEQQIYVKPPDATSPDRYFVTMVPLPPSWETRADGCDETRYLVKNVDKATTIRNFCMRKLIQKPILNPGAFTEPYERVEMVSSMLALDLKTLSFAFETMLRRMSTDETVPQDESRSLSATHKTPRKYRAYHNNTEVHNSVVGSDAYTLTSGAVDTADKLYAAVFVGSTPEGTLLLPSAKVTVAADGAGYGGLFVGSLEGLTEYTPAQESMIKRCREASILSTPITWTDYPHGAIEYGYGALHLWPDPWGGFVCHPEGHYSLCLGPLEAYPDAVTSSTPVNPANMVFSFIDIFRFKTGVDSFGADKEILTTNLALANQACGTAHTVQEFYSQATYYPPPALPSYAFLTAGYQATYTLNGSITTQPTGASKHGFYPTANRSLRGLDSFGHQSNIRSSPRRHPMWVGNFTKKIPAEGWRKAVTP